MALSLVKTSIYADANNAYLDGSIVLEFNQDLNLATVTESTVFLFLLPDYNPFSISRQVDGKNLIIAPSPGIFLQNRSYEIVIVSGPSGIKSSTNEELASNIVIPFRTKESLKPVTTPPPDPVTILDRHDIVSAPVNDNVTVLIPDTRPQGNILPYTPCPPEELEAFLNGESGTIFIPGSGITSPVEVSSILKPVGSDPENYSIGLTDLSVITIYWPENIYIDDPAGVATLTYQVLTYPMNPFVKTTVDITVTAIQNQLIIQTSGLPSDITNHEFTLVLNPLKIRNLDSSKKNVLERFHFLGVLDPMMCTVDIARANAGLWMEQFSAKDYYEYSKLIHMYTLHYIKMSPHLDFTKLTQDQIESFSRYVCCSTALDMLTSGTEANPGTGMGSNSSLFVRKRQLPGVTIEYGELSDGNSKNGTAGSPGKESLKRLLECIEKNKPKQERVQDKGPMSISTGTKSLYDTSMSIPVRRRL
jgi:hypothetical protein